MSWVAGRGMSKQISVLTGVLFAKVCLGLLVEQGAGRWGVRECVCVCMVGGRCE